MNIVLLGPPGSGKGTQGVVIAERFNLKRIVSGDLLREVAKQDSDLGRKIKSTIEKGELISDQVIIEMISNKIKDIGNGFILDGFPRTLQQAQYLEDALSLIGSKIDLVIELVVEDHLLLKRISGRYSCSNCSTGYNKFFYLPKIDSKCDKCGGTEFTCRADDNEQTVGSRLDVYKKQTAPIIPFYMDRGVLRRINSAEDVNEVSKNIIEEINKYYNVS